MAIPCRPRFRFGTPDEQLGGVFAYRGSGQRLSRQELRPCQIVKDRKLSYR